MHSRTIVEVRVHSYRVVVGSVNKFETENILRVLKSLT